MSGTRLARTTVLHAVHASVPDRQEFDIQDSGTRTGERAGVEKDHMKMKMELVDQQQAEFQLPKTTPFIPSRSQNFTQSSIRDVPLMLTSMTEYATNKQRPENY